MPTPSADGLIIYGVPDPDQGQTTSTSKGRSLKPLADVKSGWNNGDTLTCTGTGFETLVLGRNNGLTYLLQGLLCAFVAVGSGIIALIGFASRRHRARAMAVQGA